VSHDAVEPIVGNDLLSNREILKDASSFMQRERGTT